MEKKTNLDAWKLFLKARIMQEQGNDKEALDIINKAITMDPNNPHFLNARSFALTSLNRQVKSADAKIANAYADLAQRYTGKQDKPELWIEGLQEILAKVETIDRDGPAGMVAVCW